MPLPPPWAGVEQVSRVLVNSALADRFDLRIIKSNVRTSNADKGRWDLAGIWRVLLVAARLTLSLIFRRPSVVYLPLSQNAAGLARDLFYISICRLFRVPVVAHLHGSMLPHYLARQPAWRRAAIVRGIRGVAKIVVCGDAIARDLRPIFQDRVAVVPNATPPESFIARSPRRDGETVAYMAHLSRAKGFFDLLDAAEVVLARRPNAKFVFAGERLKAERNFSGAGAEPTLQRFEELERRYPGRVKYAGVVSGAEKAAFLAEADLFALPSYAEAFPVSILEAMAAELPVIATPVGAVPEVVRPGMNGLLTAPGNPAALSAAILKLVENAGERAELARGAVKTAREFSVDRQVGELSAVLDEAAKI